MFQVLKRHFARYTPQMVAKVAGVPEDRFLKVCELITENSGRDRTTAFVYSLGWTQHTVGVQYIRTAAILQLLLGNIGRPGGGILALRGQAAVAQAQEAYAHFRSTFSGPRRLVEVSTGSAREPKTMKHASKGCRKTSTSVAAPAGVVTWRKGSTTSSEPPSGLHRSGLR